MTERLPAAARRILQDGVLCYVAAASPLGPHCTPVVFVLDGGRLWLTTARRSAKAGLWHLRPDVSGLVPDASSGTAVTFRGKVRTYDALDPLRWPAATIAGPRLMRAAARFSVKNARFFAGYAVDANRVPLAWTPPGRVFAAVGLIDGAVIRDGEVVDRWGGWRNGARFEPRHAVPERRTSLDRGVPEAVRAAVGPRGRGALALTDRAGRSTVVPARWARVAAENAYEAAIPAGFAALAGARSGARAALTIDRASTWRAADMTGMLLRGETCLFEPRTATTGGAEVRRRLRRLDAGEGSVLVRLHPDRIVWWQGWTSGTVSARVR